jgi:hypothetical protein
VPNQTAEARGRVLDFICLSFIVMAVCSVARGNGPSTSLSANDPHATLITIHQQNAPFADVITEIGRESGFQIGLAGAPGMAQNWPAVTLNADAQPFWSVLIDSCRQAKAQIRVGSVGRPNIVFLMIGNFGRGGRYFTSGPVMGLLERIQHWDRLTESPPQQDQCTASVKLFVEPRLQVLFYEQDGNPTMAEDENGISLVPPSDLNHENSFRGSMRIYRGPFGHYQLMQNGIEFLSQMSYTIHLQTSARTGRKIAHFKGEIGIWLAGEESNVELTDLKSIKAKLQPVYKLNESNSLTLQNLSIQNSYVQLQVKVDRSPGETEDAWNRRRLVLSSLRMSVFDGDGNVWSGEQQPGYGFGDAQFDLYFNASRQPGQTQRPAKIILHGTVDTQEIVLPYDFSDLPLP